MARVVDGESEVLNSEIYGCHSKPNLDHKLHYTITILSKMNVISCIDPLIFLAPKQQIMWRKLICTDLGTLLLYDRQSSQLFDADLKKIKKIIKETREAEFE